MGIKHKLAVFPASLKLYQIREWGMFAMSLIVVSDYFSGPRGKKNGVSNVFRVDLPGAVYLARQNGRITGSSLDG